MWTNQLLMRRRAEVSQHIVERSVQLREGDLNVVRDNRRAA